MKAINTLQIELAQLEERISGLRSEVEGYQQLISDRQRQLHEYEDQAKDIKVALEKIQ